MRGTLPPVCSPTCRDTLHPPATPIPVKEKACAQCGKEFKCGRNGRGRKAKYCSRKCGKAAAYSSLSDKACRVCGSVLTVTQARNALKVCSRQCMLRSMEQARTKECAICGDQFKAKYSGQACCSSVCANVHAGKTRAAKAILPTIVATCKHCGKRYTPKAANRLDYCSRECAYAAKREIAKKCPVCGLTATQHATGNFCPVAIETSCAYCGKTFLAHRGRKCCSQTCYKARASRISCDYAHAKLLARVPMTKPCAHCGKEFSLVMRPDRIYCSERCAERAAKNNRMHYERQADIHPRASPVHRARIFKRDNYVCKICGQPIDFGLPPGDPMSGTIDHIIPLSKGGWHGPDNVQSAHLRCNSKKGAH